MGPKMIWQSQVISRRIGDSLPYLNYPTLSNKIEEKAFLIKTLKKAQVKKDISQPKTLMTRY